MKLTGPDRIGARQRIPSVGRLLTSRGMMKRLTGVMTTTHVDRHGDQMMLSALESVLQHVTRQYVPVTVNHDPRLPPIGRVTKAWLKELDDGEYALMAESELFEPGDPIPPVEHDREIPIRRCQPGQLEVFSDRGLSQPEDDAAVGEIARLLGTVPQHEVKKALEPITILTIGAGVVLGGIFSGLLARLGEDLYDLLKQRVGELMARRRDRGESTLLRLTFTLNRGDHQAEVQAIATDPTPAAVREMLESGVRVLDEVLPSMADASPEAKRFVFEFIEGSMRYRFAVRRDAVPILPAFSQKDDDA